MPRVPEDKEGGVGSLELQLEMVVSNHTGAGNLTPETCAQTAGRLSSPQLDCKPIVLAFCEAEDSVSS